MQVVERKDADASASAGKVSPLKSSYQPSLFEIRFGTARSKRPGGRSDDDKKTEAIRPSKRSKTAIEEGKSYDEAPVDSGGTTTDPEELLPVTRASFIKTYHVEGMQSVYYQRDWVEAKTAHRWHNELKSLKEWYRPKLKVYGREIQQSRSIAGECRYHSIIEIRSSIHR